LLASPHFASGGRGIGWISCGTRRGTGTSSTTRSSMRGGTRDYLIRAFTTRTCRTNDFVTEHVAGDLIEHPRMHPTEGYNESIIATGVWFLGEQLQRAGRDARAGSGGPDRQPSRRDGQETFLAVTLGCAAVSRSQVSTRSRRGRVRAVGLPGGDAATGGAAGSAGKDSRGGAAAGRAAPAGIGTAGQPDDR